MYYIYTNSISSELPSKWQKKVYFNTAFYLSNIHTEKCINQKCNLRIFTNSTHLYNQHSDWETEGFTSVPEALVVQSLPSNPRLQTSQIKSAYFLNFT